MSPPERRTVREGRIRTGVEVRRGSAEDAEAVGVLYTLEWGRAAEPGQVAEGLTTYPSAVAHHGGELIGVAQCGRFGPDVLELRNLVVARTHCNEGVGSQLLAALEESALRESWRGIVLVNSLGYPGKERLATKFYERAGYRTVLDTGTSVVHAKEVPGELRASGCGGTPSTA